MINEYVIKGNTFTNLYIFGTGSDAFYISMNDPIATTPLIINLDTNTFINLNTQTLDLATKINSLLNTQNGFKFSLIFITI